MTGTGAYDANVLDHLASLGVRIRVVLPAAWIFFLTAVSSSLASGKKLQ
jgi:hypothetical protein